MHYRFLWDDTKYSNSLLPAALFVLKFVPTAPLCISSGFCHHSHSLFLPPDMSFFRELYVFLYIYLMDTASNYILRKLHFSFCSYTFLLLSKYAASSFSPRCRPELQRCQKTPYKRRAMALIPHAGCNTAAAAN